jgi:hypothetical protein
MENEWTVSRTRNMTVIVQMQYYGCILPVVLVSGIAVVSAGELLKRPGYEVGCGAIEE